MGVSVDVNGVRNADGKLAKMIELRFQCDELGTSYPLELIDYFEGTDALEYDSSEKMLREMMEVSLKYGLNIPGLLGGDIEYGDGLIIDLTKMPEDIKRLRVYMS